MGILRLMPYVRAWTPARQPVWRPALHLETGATFGDRRYIWGPALHLGAGATLFRNFFGLGGV